MLIHRLVALLCTTLPTVAQDPGAPTFATGDLAALACRIIAAKPADFGLQLLTVEVRNSGRVAAEPLAFELELAGKKPDPPQLETFRRAQLPHVARLGRPVPAGGKQTYSIVTALPAKKGPIDVRVKAASFVERGELAKPALGFGKPEQVQRESMVGTFPVTQVSIHNPLPHELDVLLLVKFEQPKDVTELIGVRLPAAATQSVVLATRPGRAVWIDPLMRAPASAMKATAFEVVDWCAVGSAPADASIAMLREAYDSWYRWPEAKATVAGDFVFEQRMAVGTAGDKYEDAAIRGRFTCDAAGMVAIEIREGRGANASLLLQETLANLRRPAFDELARRNRLEPVTAERTALLGPGWLPPAAGEGHRVDGKQKAEEALDVEVAQGRIVSDGIGDGERTRWEWQARDGAQIVVGRSNASTDTRFAYATIDDRIVPTRASQRVQFGSKLFSSSELVVSNLQFEGVVPIALVPPRGEGVAPLRAMWDAGYRLPTEPIVVEAKFAVQCGNDGIWRGAKKISGSITMEGVGRSMRGSDVKFDGEMAREDEVQLAAVLRDRLGIWIARDFTDRAPFDVFFRGATIRAADAAGTFAIGGGSIASVQTSGGLVRGFRGSDGSSLAFSYGKVGEQQVVMRIEQHVGGERTPAAQRWDASVQIGWQAVGEHLLPNKLVFERIFGRDWGPESIVFRDLRLRAK